MCYFRINRVNYKYVYMYYKVDTLSVNIPFRFCILSIIRLLITEVS